MKRIKLNIDDLISVLEALKESGGTKEVIFFEYKDLPALADADEPENIIMFQAVEEGQEETLELDNEVETPIQPNDETVH